MAKSKTIVMRVDEERAEKYAEVAGALKLSVSEWMRGVLDRAVLTMNDRLLVDKDEYLHQLGEIRKREHLMTPTQILQAQIDLAIRAFMAAREAGLVEGAGFLMPEIESVPLSHKPCSICGATRCTDPHQDPPAVSVSS